MRYALGAVALTLLNQTLVYAQYCPTGYNRTIEWYQCPTEAEPALECAVLAVPLDYNDPTSSSIPIPLVRVPAIAKNPNGEQSIIFNPGGPGASGIELWAGGSGSGIQSYFGEQYNWVSFDPRGVALSTIFDNGMSNYACPPDPEYNPGPYTPDSLLPAAVSNFTLQGKDCAKNPTGMEGQYIGSPANARDVVAIAQALAGEDGFVRYYGVSYGTLLGSTLSAMFPDKLDRVILDGNINPTDYYYGDGSEAAADIDAGVVQFFHECALAPNLCVLANKNQTGAQLLQQYKDVYAGFLNTAAKTGDYRDVYGLSNLITGGIKQSNLFVSTAQQLEVLYQEIANGSATRKRQVPDFDPSAAAAVSEAQQPENILTGVTCGDYLGPRVPTVNQFRTLRDAYRARSYYGYDNPGLLNIIYGCMGWQTKNKDMFNASLTNVKTRNPILFVNGLYDPVTPHISAINASAGFVGSGVLLHNAGGHAVLSEPFKAITNAMAQYWIDGKIPAQRTYNKTGNSFEVGAPVAEPDPNINSTVSANSTHVKRILPVSHLDSNTNSANLKEVYPRELLDMLKAHANTIQRRATNSSSRVPAGCTPTAPATYVGAAGKTAVATSVMIVAVVAALIL